MNGEFYKTELYDYVLPEELIAQYPVKPRDSSRLMVIHREKGTFEHRSFRDIDEYLRKDDLLVLNDTKVMAARLFGTKEGGSARVEILLLAPLDSKEKDWEALIRPGKKFKPGSCVRLCDGSKVKIRDRMKQGTRAVSFSENTDVKDLLTKLGRVPLPPYVHNDNINPGDYQTIFARRDGSSAAPTGSLHFTPELLNRIKDKVDIGWVTLHVGLGTFRPVKEQDIRNHEIHQEFCEVPQETVRKLSGNRGRIIAAGTTVVRTLESMTDFDGVTSPGRKNTDLFIYPGYKFRKTDAIITNFHLPKSTLLMLVSAFAGRETIMRAYEDAIKERYRFFSFGDAMLII